MVKHDSFNHPTADTVLFLLLFAWIKGVLFKFISFCNMQRKNIYYSFIFVFVYLHIYKLIIDWNISLISSGFIIISKHNFYRFSTSHHCIKVTLTHNQLFYLRIYVPVFINSYYELLFFFNKKNLVFNL